MLQLQDLIEQTTRQGITVLFDKASVLRCKPGTYNIPSIIHLKWRGIAKEQEMMWDLLHELGHAAIRSNWIVYRSKYPAAALEIEKRIDEGETKYRRRVGCIVDRMREEVEAWEVGLSIAEKSGIPINYGQYWKYANKYVASYMHHLSDKLLRRSL